MSPRLASMIDTLHQFGILPGDRIAAFLPNSQFLIDLVFAAWHLGANICPLNMRLPLAQIDLYLTRLKPKLYVNPEGFFLREGTPCSVFSSLFLFTSGSTGTPKIAVLSRGNLLANASGAIPFVDLRKKDRWLLSLPLFHVGGIGIVLRCTLVGAQVVFDPHDPGITHMSFVPTQLFRTTPMYKNLRCLVLGGAPANFIPPNLPICLTYGLTEMGSMVTSRFNPPCINGHFYLGHPLPHRQVRISADGEIELRGECLFQGYWENGVLSLPLKDGWFPTGDLGHYCPKEGLVVLGRKDWQFISGGENIQPEEIERALLQCPEIQEAIVIPRKDPEFGFRPVAYVRTTDPEFTFEKMKVALLDRLAKYKIPVAMNRVEEFPRKGLKVDRNRLRDSL